MTDIAIKDTLKTYFNGTLAGTPNAVYDEIVNREIVKPSHRKRKANNSFHLKKRRGFKQIFTPIPGVITDVQDLYDTTCDDQTGWRYYYSITSTHFYVYKREIGGCINPVLVDSGLRNLCAGTKFLRTDFVKGPKRKLYTAGSVFDSIADVFLELAHPLVAGAIPAGANTFAWDATNGPKNGDYFRAYRTVPGDDSIAGQARRIIGNGTYSAKTALRFDSPFLMSSTASPTVDDDFSFAVFPEWGEVLLYNSIDSGYMGATDLPCVKIIHSPHSIDGAGVKNNTDTITTLFTTIDELGTSDKVVTTMTEHNGYVVMTFDNGHLAYGSNDEGDASYHKFLWDIDRTVIQNIGKDLVDAASFRNFLILFGRDRVIATVFDIQGNAKRFELRDNLGIHNKGAWCLYENSFYMIGSDKRLYGLNISGDGDGLILELDDQSQPMLGHLEAIKEGDNVYLHVDKEEIKIFHVIDHTGESSNNISYNSKIIIFNKDYGLVHHWETKTALTGVRGDEYYGGTGTPFHLCGKEDPLGFPRSYINCYIGDSEPTGVETNIFEKKSINRGKIVLGNGIYNNAYTYMRVWTWENGQRTVKTITGFSIYSLSLYNSWLGGSDLAGIEDCVSLQSEESLWNGVEFTNQDGRDRDKVKEDSRCGSTENFSCPDYVEDNVEGINIHSNLYKLGGTNVVYVPVSTRPADIIKVEFVSSGGDEAEFGGMLFEIQRKPIDDIGTYGSNVIINSNCTIPVFG